MKKIVTLSLFFLTSVSVFAMEEDKDSIYVRAPQPLSASQQVLLRALREAPRVGLTCSPEIKEEIIGLYEALEYWAPLGTSLADMLKILTQKGGATLLTDRDQLQLRRDFAVDCLKWANGLRKDNTDDAALVERGKRISRVLVEMYQNRLDEMMQQDIEVLSQRVADDLFNTPAAFPLKEQIPLKFSLFIRRVRSDRQVDDIIPDWHTITSTDGLSSETMAQLSQVVQAHFPAVFDAETLADFGSVWQGPPALLETGMLLFYRKYVQLEIEHIFPNFLENMQLPPADRSSQLQRMLIDLAFLPVLDAKILQLKEQPAVKSVLPAYVETLLKGQRDRLQDILLVPGERKGIDLLKALGALLEAKADQIRHSSLFTACPEDRAVALQDMRSVTQKDKMCHSVTKEANTWGSFDFAAYPEDRVLALPDMRAAIKADGFLEANLDAFREKFEDLLCDLSKDDQRDSQERWALCFSAPKADVVYQAFKSRTQNPEAFKDLKKRYGWAEAVMVSFVRETSVRSKKSYEMLMSNPNHLLRCPDMAEKILFFEALIGLLDENLKARFTGEVL